jgi:16S rRNA (adenine1518-N6/adenine1519-N6)-dimethyltransferase
VRKLFKVGAGCFIPAPKVDSAVVRIDLYKEPKYDLRSEKLFRSTIKAAFEMRRKTLLNALSSGLGLNKEKILDAISFIGKPADVRGERLSTAEFAALSNYLYDNK